MFGARIMDSLLFWDWLVGCLVLLDCYVIGDVYLGFVVIYVCDGRNMRCLVEGILSILILLLVLLCFSVGFDCFVFFVEG